MGVGNHIFFLNVLGQPLPCPGWAFHQFPFVAEESVEVAHVPFRGVRFPSTFNSAAGGIHADTRAEFVSPAQAHLLHRGAFGFATDEFGVARPVTFSKGVAACDESHCFLVVHGHAGESFADIACGGDGIGFSVRALGVHIDQSHLDGAEGLFQLPIARVALVAQPGGFRTPVDIVFRFPDVFATATEAEGFEAHRFEGAVASENEEIGPGELVAVLFLNGPKEAAGLVQVDVIGPAVERGEALVSGSGTSASVERAVGAGAVPGHPDEEGAVVSPIRGPPGFGVGHQGVEVLLDGREVQFFELCGVVEVPAHRVGQVGVKAEDLKIEAMRPPGVVRGGDGFGAGSGAAGKWAFGCGGHIFSFFEAENLVIQTSEKITQHRRDKAEIKF